MRIVGWFSCGNNSAVMARLLVEKYSHHDLKIARCVVDNEHPDNDRFHEAVETWIGRSIERLRAQDYRDCWDVWEKERYLSGVKGAKCTTELKKAVRWTLEKTWQPDFQAFGFSADEKKRSERFIKQNPDVRLLRPLEDEGITKADCATIIAGAGIELPAMYGLGFSNNNCIGCVKATSPTYWARVRHYFPETHNRMAELSRRLGCRLVRLKGRRIFLDELPADYDWRNLDTSKDVECGVLCGSRG